MSERAPTLQSESDTRPQSETSAAKEPEPVKPPPAEIIFPSLDSDAGPREDAGVFIRAWKRITSSLRLSSRLSSISSVIGSLRSILVDTAVLLLFVVLIIAGIMELRTHTSVLDPVSVPKDLADRGYSADVVAARLNDEMQKIIRDGSNVSALKQIETTADKSLATQLSAQRPDIDVPVSGISIQNAFRYLRYAFGFPETHIGGSVTHEGGQMQLVLRTSGPRGNSYYSVFTGASLDELLGLGAQQIIKERSPLLLAGYFFRNEDKDPGYKKAEEALSLSVNRSNDPSGWPYFLWGQVFRKRKQFDEAIEKYKEAIKRDPNDAESYNNWGTVLSQQADILSGQGDVPGAQLKHEEAIEKYRKTSEILRDSSPTPFRNWCSRLIRLRRFDEAILKCKQAVDLDPDYLDAYREWGKALEGLHKYEEALQIRQRAAEVDPKSAPVQLDWGLTLAYLERFDEAIARYKRAVELDPAYMIAHYDWGVALQSLGRYDEAIERYQRAAELDRNYADTYINWGSALETLGKHDQAIEKYKRASEIAPKLAMAFAEWGRSLISTKSYREAIVKFQKATELDPNYATAYQLWGDALSKLGKSAEASAKYARARELEPK